MLIGRYSAILDANVLHPAFLRDAILWFADARLLRPVWSGDILAEWRRSVQRRFPDKTNAQLDRLEAVLRKHFPDALVDGYQPFIEQLALPDPDDRHVLAAAIVGRCNGIITCNLKHFPADALDPFGIEVVHPDEFLVNMIDLDEDKAIAACRRHRDAMTKSKPTVDDYLRAYETRELFQTHLRLSSLKGRL